MAKEFPPGASMSDVSANQLADFTVAFLAEHEAHCPECDYNVRGQPTARCPECGRELALQLLTVAGDISRPWVIGLIAAAICSGTGLFVAAIAMHFPLPPMWSWQIPILFHIAAIPAPAVVLLAREWFLRWPPLAQWIVAVAWLGVCLSMAGWFLMKVVLD
jgi:hypothetical protein